MKLKHIYIDGNDKHVGKYLAFGKASDSKLYVDEELTEQVSQDDLQEAFKKGLLLVQVGTDIFEPVKVSGNKVVVLDLSSGSVSGKEYAAKANA